MSSRSTGQGMVSQVDTGAGCSAHVELAAAPRLSARLAAKVDARMSILWAVDDLGRVFRLDPTNGKVEFIPLQRHWHALQIVVSCSGKVWVTAWAAERRIYAVLKLSSDHSGWLCEVRSTSPYLIAGASTDDCWLLQGRSLTSTDHCFQSQTSMLPFEAVQISEGLDGTLWAVGGERRRGGFAVWRRDQVSKDWFKLPQPASAVRISGARDGTAWGANSHGDIWRFHPNGAGNFRECSADANCRNCLYTPRKEAVRDLSVGPDGVVWFLSAATAPNGYSIGRISNRASCTPLYPARRNGAISIAASTTQADGSLLSWKRQ